MASLVYSPQIRARIATSDDVYDVSSDISGATITRRTGVSTFSLTLTNRGRKYEGKFKPMDRVTIYLKRIGPFLLVMSGYLDAVPVYSTYSASVTVRGSCTLKRLQNWYWDPASEAGASLVMLQTADAQDPSITDGGVAQRVVDILDKVVGWPKQKIHIGAIPDQWFESLGSLGEATIAKAEMIEMMANVANGTMSGENLLIGTATVAGVGEGTGTLPAQIASVGTYGGSNGGPGVMALTGEPIRLDDNARASWGGQYYMQAPWPYLDEDGRVPSGVDLGKARTWWRNRPILLTNPRTGKGVVVRAAHWGPDGGAEHVNISRPAYRALGLETGQAVHIAFPPIGKDALGPVVISPASSGGGAGSTPLPIPGGGLVSQAVATAGTIARVTTDGMPTHPTATVGSTFAVLEEFLRWCVSQGIKPTEHPMYGGVTPGYHMSIEAGGFHWWPASTNGGGAADLVVPAGGQEMQRKLDMAALKASQMGLGVIWRAPNHWTHMHVSVQAHRDIGRLVYADDAALRALPPLSPLDGSPGTPGSGGSGGDLDPARMGQALIQTFQMMDDWRGDVSGLIGGPQALINDVAIYGTIDELFKVGLRDWCSAPNGDIIAWFPDYFGRHGTAAKMIIEPVEVAGDGFNIEWSDERLKTHMFVTGSDSPAGFLLSNPGLGSARQEHNMSRTAGIASVEYPQMMKALFGLDTFSARGAEAFLERFGARPDWEPMDVISGPRAEFFFSVYRFMRNWSQQYTTRVQLTFMPELYPGMVVAFPHWGIQAYVEQVTHTINMDTGFMTNVVLTAWSKIGGSDAVIDGLPIGGPL